jgi:membrane fusion protein (multidrug efflux system)
VRVDSHPNDVFMGKIETIDPKVNPGTRAAAIRATLANADGKLLPGMYATAHIETGMPATYITVPQTVVTFNPYGNTVFKVEKKVTDGKETLVATQAFVTTGETRGDQIAILTGVKEGDTLVSAGQFKLQNGATVQINNEVQPSNDPNPAPTER